MLEGLFRRRVSVKLAVIFSVEQLLCHLQRVLETHEVNWKHVLCFLSTLLVYNPQAQPSLRGKERKTPVYLSYWVKTAECFYCFDHFDQNVETHLF